MAEFTKGQTVYLRDWPPSGRRVPAGWGEVREAQIRMFKDGFVYLTNREGKFEPDWMEIEDREGTIGVRVFATRQEAEEYPEVMKEWELLAEYLRAHRQPIGIALAAIREAARLVGADDKEP